MTMLSGAACHRFIHLMKPGACGSRAHAYAFLVRAQMLIDSWSNDSPHGAHSIFFFCAILFEERILISHLLDRGAGGSSETGKSWFWNCQWRNKATI
jgi:hypothetical protein